MRPSLAHERITAPNADPHRWLYVLHGIYGAGRNWRTVAQRTVEARPEWGAVLVDLPGHGGSREAPAPYTLAAAAEDLRRLFEHLNAPAAGILGHSFGGKVALSYARDFVQGDEELEQVWLVDSTPAARQPGGSAWEILGVLRRVPASYESRTEAIDAVASEGVARPVAQWLSTNLERTDEGFRWALDLDAMEAYLRDFFRTDLWDAVEAPTGAELHLIKAEESSVLPDGACERIEAAGRANGRVFLHRLEGGHWLNAENPDGVVELLRTSLAKYGIARGNK